MTPEKLLNTLENLKDKEFKKFKWHLKGYNVIKECKLDEAGRCDTVDLMVKAYKPSGAWEMTEEILGKIPRNDLVQTLSDTNSKPEGQSHFFLLFVLLDGEKRLTTQYL